jgi:hypothetical protein
MARGLEQINPQLAQLEALLEQEQARKTTPEVVIAAAQAEARAKGLEGALRVRFVSPAPAAPVSDVSEPVGVSSSAPAAIERKAGS